jgi:GalNAc-alpha-(1->4)-GalNAc-alpha-(1->3)-diNAcBac-PP-undecaprenol alpha-1,4-N-acetyl-D-galactosaminyltransferase
VHILFFIYSYNIGGAEKQAFEIAKYLKRNSNHAVSFLSFSKDGPLTQQLKEEKIECHHIDLDLFILDNFNGLKFSRSSVSYYLKYTKQIDHACSVIRKIAPDKIIPFTYYPNVISSLVCEQLKLYPIIWNQRDLGTEGFVNSYAEKRSLSRVSVIVGNSKKVIEFMKTRIGDNNYVLIHNGIDIAQVEKISKKANADKTALMIGNLHKNKNQEALVKAWALLTKKEGYRNAKLKLVGRFDGMEKKLTDLTKQLHLENNIEISPAVDNVYSEIMQSTLFAFSSLTEGSPNAVIEAMACEKTVVASDIEPVKELLGKDYPFLCPPNDHHCFAEKLFMAFENNEKSTALGKQNKSIIVDNYSIRSSASKWEQVLN